MEAGTLRHRITLRKKTVTRDTRGGEVVSRATFATVWASVEPLQGREYFAADKENAEVTHRIRLRYLKGVTSSMDVLWGTRVFDIESVLNIGERNRELHLMAVEEV